MESHPRTTDTPDRALGAPRGTRPAVGAAMNPIDWIRLFRPQQWVKNLFVLAPLLFSGRGVEWDAVARAFGAFVLFSVVASGIYAINDVVDRDADRAHPTKKYRPIAAGRISPHAGILVGAVLVAVAVSGAWFLDPRFGGVAAGYAVLNLAYTLRLKDVVILDVFCIAGFFLLRLLAGSVVIDVRPSVWLLVCGGLLALYLGFAKRRHELLLLEEGSTLHRSVLSSYDTGLLDQMSAVLLSVTAVAYLMYTLTSETAAAVGTETLSYSLVFVLYGMFRYLYLVHRHGRGSPTETLLTDRALLVAVGMWLLYCGWVIYRPF